MGFILGFASPIILALNHSKQNPKSDTAINKTKFQEISPTPDKSKGVWRDIEISVLSPGGNYLAYTTDYSKDGIEATELYIQEQTNEYFVQRERLVEIWETPKSDSSGRQLIVWGPQGKWLALKAENKIVIVKIDKLGFDKYHKEVIKPDVIFETDANIDLSGELYLWFENDSLVASYKDGVYKIWPEKEKLIDIEDNIGIYPSLGSYLYWQNESECCGIKLMQIDKKTKKVTETGLTVVDYAGKVLANRSGNRICVETGSSGFYGYILYDLIKKNNVRRGQQYSYCGQWIDNNQISLIEIPYHHQWSKQIYIYDWESNTRYPVNNLHNN